MKDFIKSLGGAGWVFFLGLSALVTVIGSFGLPYVVDTSNPWILLLCGAVVFALAFGNGWKQRGFKNQKDIELSDRLERERIEDAKNQDLRIEEIKQVHETERLQMQLDHSDKERDRQQKAEKEAEQLEDQRCRITIESLPLTQSAMLYRALCNDRIIEVSPNDGDALALQDSGIFKKLGKSGMFSTKWKVSDDWYCRMKSWTDIIDALEERAAKHTIQKRTDRVKGIRDLDFEDQFILYEVFTSEYVDISEYAYDVDGECAPFVDSILIGDNTVRISLKDEYRNLIAENEHYCFAGVKTYLAKYSTDEAD